MPETKDIQGPFSTSQTRTLLPRQGGISETFLVVDEQEGKTVHKIMNPEKLGRWGGNASLIDTAQSLQRIHAVLSNIFKDHVAKTQFLLAESNGEKTIEVLQEFVEGQNAEESITPTADNLQQWIIDVSGGRRRLTDTIREQAKVSTTIAHYVVNDLMKSENWMERTSDGQMVLVDF